MRNFIRHPSNIPIEFQLEEMDIESSEKLKNFSVGGLSFNSKIKLPIGTCIRITIPLVKPVYKVVGRVSWCLSEGTQYEVGIEFLDKDDLYRTRMVEQICHIEQYKQEVLEKDGRKLSSKEAAQEWIEEYAPEFPGTEDHEK